MTSVSKGIFHMYSWMMSSFSCKSLTIHRKWNIISFFLNIIIHKQGFSSQNMKFWSKFVLCGCDTFFNQGVQESSSNSLISLYIFILLLHIDFEFKPSFISSHTLMFKLLWYVFIKLSDNKLLVNSYKLIFELLRLIFCPNPRADIQKSFTKC